MLEQVLFTISGSRANGGSNPYSDQNFTQPELEENFVSVADASHYAKGTANSEFNTTEIELVSYQNYRKTLDIGKSNIYCVGVVLNDDDM